VVGLIVSLGTLDMQQSTSHEVDRWKNRRKMAWASLVAGLLFPLLILFTGSTELSEIAVPFYAFVGMVVTVYIGGAVVDDHWQNQNAKP